MLPENVRILDLEGDLVTLDPKHLSFNDATLSKFCEEISMWYDYFSSKSTKAEEIAANAETAYEHLEAEKFLSAKASGLGSDKVCEATASIDPDVKAAKERMDHFKNYVKQMKEWLRSLDKAHTMAINRGHMLRKELEKLNSNINSASNLNELIDQITSNPLVAK